MRDFFIRYRLKLPQQVGLEQITQPANSMIEAIQMLEEKLIANGATKDDFDILYAVDINDINGELLIEIDNGFRKHFNI